MVPLLQYATFVTVCYLCYSTLTLLQYATSVTVCYLWVADQHHQRTQQMVQSTEAILEEYEVHEVPNLLKVDLGDDHADGVSGGQDDGEEAQTEQVAPGLPGEAVGGGEAAGTQEQEADRQGAQG